MKKILYLAIAGLCLFQSCTQSTFSEEGKDIPAAAFFQQRAYPFEDINQKVYFQASDAVKAMQMVEQRSSKYWTSVGPTNIGGRVTDVAINPNNSDIIFAGTASGGIFKTTNRGENWKPVFDEAGRLSIGSLAIAPSNDRVLYAGTGEANGSGTSGAFFGDGIYRSTDGGRFWENVGLRYSGHIGRVVVHPTNENHAFVAAAGTLYSKNEERGLFETKDGGTTWERIFYLNDSTSCIDVVLNPRDTNMIYAVMWERQRFPWQRDYAGESSGIYRSIDGGTSWERLGNGLPQANAQIGRIGLAISPSNPNVLYASFTRDSITNSFDGLYKSLDGGDTWQRTNDFYLGGVYSSFGWYFGNLRVHPTDPNKAYVLGLSLFETKDGGDLWRRISSGVHVDQHALEFDLNNPDFMVLGNDGGIYLSENGGQNWKKAKGLPITQFYECEVAANDPEILLGGTQDNGTIMTSTGSENDWYEILGGDGFSVLVDPEVSEIVYAGYQWGNLFRSFDGGESFQWALNGISRTDRNNWNTPYIIDPVNTSILYYGTHRLYRSSNRAGTWERISEDLTKGGRSGLNSYGTITTIAVSPVDNSIIYVGTDDGNVQTSKDNGQTWELVSQVLPNRYVTSIFADPTNPLIAYITFSGYRKSDYLPHVYKTEDGGSTWMDISSNLPEVPVNDIILDNRFSTVLYVATDLGVWFTKDGGKNWQPLGNGFPTTIATDLALHQKTRTLVAATYGRSLYVYKLDQDLPKFPPDNPRGNLLTVATNASAAAINITLTAAEALEADLYITAADGRPIYQQSRAYLQPGTQQLPIASSLFRSQGIYFLTVRSGGWQQTERFVFVGE